MSVVSINQEARFKGSQGLFKDWLISAISTHRQQPQMLFMVLQIAWETHRKQILKCPNLIKSTAWWNLLQQAEQHRMRNPGWDNFFYYSQSQQLEMRPHVQDSSSHWKARTEHGEKIWLWMTMRYTWKINHSYIGTKQSGRNTTGRTPYVLQWG